MSTIAVEALTKRYRTVTAVDDLTFGLAPGRITGFAGARAGRRCGSPRGPPGSPASGSRRCSTSLGSLAPRTAA